MARRKFDYRGYPCGPTDITKNTWFYVKSEGLVICRRMADGNPAEMSIIPWRMVKRALADHEKAKDRRPAARGKKP